MINAVSVNNAQVNSKAKYSPNFGSVILSRVVLKTVKENGDVFYTPLSNKERGIVGVYQSLARKINASKNSIYTEKLKKAIKDLNAGRAVLHSTLIGVRSSFKRFLLTGKDARRARDLGIDLIGGLGNKKIYAQTLKDDILNDTRKRVLNSDGDEIGIDLIVEGSSRKRKLVDVEVLTLDEISKAKPPRLAIKKTKPEIVKDSIVQSTFGFFDEVK